MPELRDPIFVELDRLITAGAERVSTPHLPTIPVTKTKIYNLRRRVHPRHWKQHAEPWQVRRNAYLAMKSLPPEAV